MEEQCPCGSGERLIQCCGPLLAGDRFAATAEALMRSRYTAFALGDASYLAKTWDPRTRPDDIRIRSEQRWIGLRIVETTEGGPDDASGEVEFIARSKVQGRASRLHERSRFRRAEPQGVWLYVDGDIKPPGR